MSKTWMASPLSQLVSNTVWDASTNSLRVLAKHGMPVPQQALSPCVLLSSITIEVIGWPQSTEWQVACTRPAVHGLTFPMPEANPGWAVLDAVGTSRNHEASLLSPTPTHCTVSEGKWSNVSASSQERSFCYENARLKSLVCFSCRCCKAGS